MHDTGTTRLALIYETGGDHDGEIASDLAQAGWQARVLARDVDPLLTEQSGLWVVRLAPEPSDSLDFLKTLARARTRVPLLVVVEAHQLPRFAHQLERLLRNWLAPVDLLVWPYMREELRLRLSRLSPTGAPDPDPPTLYERGMLRVDSARYRVSVDGRSVELTPAEFRILLALVKGDGQLVSREDLLKLLGVANGEDRRKTIETHMSRLRRKLEAAGMDRNTIRNMRGVGYCLETLPTARD